jgi:two-component sensor histidine kinase
MDYINKYKNYLKKYHNLICDKESTSFHVKARDYFASLATILDLLSQSHSLTEKEIKNILKSLAKDLLYLQENYRIIEKDQKNKIL